MTQPHREAMMQAAEEASAIVLRYFAAVKGEVELDLGKRLKSDKWQDFVTHADCEAQDAIERVLLAAFPAYGFYAEENGRDVEIQQHHNGVKRFVVDPIDGTYNFTRGMDDFSISIALQESQAERWRNIAGLVALPAKGELFFAEGGEVECHPERPQGVEGSHTTGDPSTTLRMTGIAIEDAIFTYRVGAFQQAVARYRELVEAVGARNVKSYSTAQRLAEIAAGRTSALIVGGDFFEWDVAAGLAIAEQAGAVITEREDHGLPVRIVASHRALAEAVEQIWGNALKY